ncbi:MAG: oligosaccharide flippase family protein [Nanoarchaeota archaeon]
MANERVLGIQEIVKGAGIVFIGTFLSYFLSFIYNLIAANYLSVEEFGMLTTGIMVLSISLVLAKLGMPNGAKRFVSFYLAKNDYKRVKGIIYSSYFIVGIFSVLTGLVVFLFSGMIAEKIFHSAELAPVLRVFALAIPFSSIILLSAAVSLGFRKAIYKVVVEAGAEKGLRILFFVIVMLLGGGAIYASGAYLAGVVFGAIVSVFLVFNLAKKHNVKRAVYEHKELIYFSLPLIFTGVTGTLMRRFDKLIVGYFLGPSFVGIYAIAFSFAHILTISLSSLGALYNPIATSYFAKGKLETMARTYESVTRLSFIVSFPILLVFILFSEQVINVLYGESYTVGAGAMVILSVTFMLSLFLGPTSQTMLVINKTKQIFYISAIAAAINLSFNFILIPLLMPYNLGLEGAATATLIALAVQHILLLREIKKTVYVRAFHSYYIKYLISGAIAIGVFYFAGGILQINLITMILLAIGLAGVYGVALILLKSFTDEDKMLLKAIEKKIGIKTSIVDRVLK